MPKKILLVDDHADSLKIMAKLLRLKGYEVHTAATKSEALRLCGESEFDLLLSDLALPDGSGLGLMREMAETCGTKGIAYTGYDLKETIANSQAAGFSMHLVKPIEIEKVYQAIEKTLA